MAIVDINWRPSASVLRTFGLICVVFFSGIGAWIYFSDGYARYAAYGLWIVAGYSALCSIAKPRALLPVYWLLTAISFPIGFVVSHVVMAAVFYLLFTPIGLVFKIIGRDGMKRAFDSEAKTYWVERPSRSGRHRYFHQY